MFVTMYNHIIYIYFCNVLYFSKYYGIFWNIILNDTFFYLKLLTPCSLYFWSIFNWLSWWFVSVFFFFSMLYLLKTWTGVSRMTKHMLHAFYTYCYMLCAVTLNIREFDIWWYTRMMIFVFKQLHTNISFSVKVIARHMLFCTIHKILGMCHV